MIVVTHYQRLLNYIVPDKVHVLVDGRIVKSGGKELALELGKSVDTSVVDTLPGTLNYTIRPSYSGTDLLDSTRVIDPIPSGITYVAGSAGQGGTYGAYTPIPASDGIDTAGTPQSTVSVSASPVSVQFGAPITVTLLLNPTGAGVSNVVPDLTSVSNGVSCGAPSQTGFSIADGATGTVTYTCSVSTPGQEVSLLWTASRCSGRSHPRRT